MLAFIVILNLHCMALFSEPMRCKELWETNTNLLLTTIVESRHHAITPFLVSDGGEEGKGRVEKVYSLLNLGNGKESIESSKCLRRKRNEGVFSVISPLF